MGAKNLFPYCKELNTLASYDGYKTLNQNNNYKFNPKDESDSNYKFKSFNFENMDIGKDSN